MKLKYFSHTDRKPFSDDKRHEGIDAVPALLRQVKRAGYEIEGLLF
jgi:hypothetical protein